MEIGEILKRIENLLLISSKEALNVSECAIMLGVTEGRIRHMTCEKELPYYKQGKSVFFKKSEIEAWMLKERVPTIHEQIEERYTNVKRRK